jgi:hypothetical protein
MNNHHIVWMYARSKHAETLREIERYRLIKQAKRQRKANLQPISAWLSSLSRQVQALVSCVQSTPQGQKSVCLS